MTGDQYKLLEPWNIQDLIEKPLPKNPCWIEPAVLPKGAKMLIGGHAKSGKSFFMLELARALALGKTPFGAPGLSVPAPVKIMMLEQEIGPWGLQKRATTIFAGENAELLRQNFHGLSQIRGLRLDAPGVTQQIAEWCLKTEANVLLLDPIGKMHSYDENDATQINRLFHKLDEIIEACKDNELSIILSHHFSKPIRDPRVHLSDEDLFSPYNFRGSTRWYDDPDTLVTCNKLPPLAGSSHKWWFLKSRWETRQGGDVDEYMTFSVNRRNDLRVRWEENAGTIDLKDKKDTQRLSAPFTL